MHTPHGRNGSHCYCSNRYSFRLCHRFDPVRSKPSSHTLTHRSLVGPMSFAMFAPPVMKTALTPTVSASAHTLAAPPASHRSPRRSSSPEPREAFGQRSSDEASADPGGKAVLPPAHVLAGSVGLVLRPGGLGRRWWAGLGADQGQQ